MEEDFDLEDILHLGRSWFRAWRPPQMLGPGVLACSSPLCAMRIMSHIARPILDRVILPITAHL
jgi:hypothetical protein